MTKAARKPRGKAAGVRPPSKSTAAQRRDVRRFKRRFDGYSQRAYEYAQSVVGGAIPACKEVRFACARFLRDLDAGVWKFRPELVDKVCGFVECLPHVKAKWARIGPSGERQTIALQDWQIFILAGIFGFVGDDGTRRVRKAFIMLPRKNGKSVLAAAIGLFMLTMDDEPGAEIYCGATSEKQAWEVFRPAKRMAELVPDFRGEFGLSANAKSLTLPDLSFFQPTIGDPGDGPSPHCAIVDEYHEHAASGQLDSFVTGMGARSQPLLLIITTAGVNVAGPCFDEDKYARMVLAGMVEDDELFAIIYTIDDDDDWRDFAVWIKANPNYGVSIEEKYLRARHKEACERTSKQNINRTKHLNQWVSSRSALLNILKWQRCKVEFTDDFLHEIVGLPATIGCDLAVVLDLAAIVLRVGLPDGREFYWPKFYLPEATVEDTDNKNHPIYKKWVEAGFITATPGNTTDYEFILEDLKFWLALFDVVAIGFDPWQSNMLSTMIKNEGANVFEFGMSTRNLSAPTKELEAGVINATLLHPGNPVFDWNASNVTAKEDARGNVYPRKPDQGEHMKIDGIIAAVIAKGLAMNEAPTAPPTVTVLD